MKTYDPLYTYLRHIAHANNIIFKEVLNDIKKQNSHEQQ